jgi:hypothetical protein
MQTVTFGLRPSTSKFQTPGWRQRFSSITILQPTTDLRTCPACPPDTRDFIPWFECFQHYKIIPEAHLSRLLTLAGVTRDLMPAATTPSASPLPPTMSKMEDRKRPAISSADDLAPPSKRVAVNGSKTKDEGPEMKEESWVDVSKSHLPCLVHSHLTKTHRPRLASK